MDLQKNILLIGYKTVTDIETHNKKMIMEYYAYDNTNIPKLEYYTNNFINVDINKKFQITVTLKAINIPFDIHIYISSNYIYPNRLTIKPEEISANPKNYIFNIPIPYKTGDYTIEFHDNVNPRPYIFNYHVIDAGTLSFKDITYWTYGLTDIPSPNPKQWGIAQENEIKNNILYPKRIGLEWQSGMGWYDCTKINPSNLPEIPVKDSNLCWAATAANMIHWWMDINKENIKRYNKFNGPSIYHDALHSDIFDWFKANYPNEGNNIYTGLYDFLYNTGRGGFFYDVLKTLGRNSIYESRNGTDLNEMLKKAFKQGDAVGISISSGPNRAHALNVWGAHFNDSGIVDTLYVANNDDADILNDETRPSPMVPGYLCRYGLFDVNVWLDENREWHIDIDRNKDTRFIINKVINLHRCDKQWNMYFNPPKVSYTYDTDLTTKLNTPIKIDLNVNAENIYDKLNIDASGYDIYPNKISIDADKINNNPTTYTFIDKNVKFTGIHTVKIKDNVGNSFNINYKVVE